MQELLLFAPPATLVAAIAAGIFGLLIGSFLNVVIHRLPIMEQRETENAIADIQGTPEVHTDTYNLVLPRSACPHCKHQITAMENIPVVSYLALGGRCSNCKAKISPRYPLVEAFTGLLSAGLVWQMGSGWAGMAALLFAYLLIALTFIDIDEMMLPDALTYPLLWIGLLLNVNALFAPLRDAVIGAAAGYLSLWTVDFLYRKIRRRQGMGGGDFKLLAALGAWMGWTMLPIIILLASVSGSFLGIIQMLMARAGLEYKIPFGPYLAIAGLVALVYSEPLQRFAAAWLAQ
jgi:leader peptidase (prepilin peptidase) / N-methyltransferase